MKTPPTPPLPQRDKQTETTSLAAFQTGTRSHVPLRSRVSRPGGVGSVRPPGRSSWTLPVEEAPAKLSPSVLLGTKTWARLQNQTCASASRLPICQRPPLPPLHRSAVFFLFFAFLSFCSFALLPGGLEMPVALLCICSAVPHFSSPLIDETRRCRVWWATLPARRPPSPSAVNSAPLVCLIAPYSEKKTPKNPQRDEKLATR